MWSTIGQHDPLPQLPHSLPLLQRPFPPAHYPCALNPLCFSLRRFSSRQLNWPQPGVTQSVIQRRGVGDSGKVGGVLPSWLPVISVVCMDAYAQKQCHILLLHGS